MGCQSGFHAPHGADFLGFRKARSGITEIVYDDGVSRRMVWQITGRPVPDAQVSDALAQAVSALRVVPALLSEMEKRAIRMERVSA